MPFDYNGFFTFTPNTLTGRWTVKRADDGWVVAENVKGFSEAVRLAKVHFENLPF